LGGEEEGGYCGGGHPCCKVMGNVIGQRKSAAMLILNCPQPSFIPGRVNIPLPVVLSASLKVVAHPSCHDD
jgi:hypothetical protein